MSNLMLFIRAQDERALAYLVIRRHALLDATMRLVTRLGSAAPTVVLAAVMASSASPGLSGAGWRAVFALVASHALVQVVKRTIARPRPDLPLGVALAAVPDRFSFPSGHAAASLSVALGAATALPDALAAVAITIAGVVGLSRCYLGVHYPGDVFAGWALALLAFFAGTTLGL